MKRLPPNLQVNALELLRRAFEAQPPGFMTVKNLPPEERQWVEKGLQNEWCLVPIHRGIWTFSNIFHGKVRTGIHSSQWVVAVTHPGLVKRR